MKIDWLLLGCAGDRSQAAAPVVEEMPDTDAAAAASPGSASTSSNRHQQAGSRYRFRPLPAYQAAPGDHQCFAGQHHRSNFQLVLCLVGCNQLMT